MSAFPEPRYVAVRRFEPEDDAALAHLDEEGYVVFRALDASEAEAAAEKLWDYLEGLGSGVDRRDPRTWTDDKWPPGVGRTGILPWFRVGHCALSWYVRSRPRVATAFRTVWRVPPGEPMVASFDGCLAWRPGAKTERGWFHVDQDALRGPGFQMVQGLVALTDTAPGTGGNVLVPRSHKDVFPRLVRDYRAELEANGGDDYFELPARDAVFADGEAICCLLRKGDLLLWDSRTVHASTPAHAADPPLRTDKLVRACSFVCMAPRASCPPDVLRERRAAFEAGVTTTHWPTRVLRTDAYDSFKALDAAVRRRFSEPPPPVPLTPEIDALI